MKHLLSEIDALVATFRKDADSHCEKGNKSAGIRARRASLDLEKLLKRYRRQSLEIQNGNIDS